MLKNTLFTSESVTEGHPDKLCDQVSDAILDAIIAGDPNARVACETTATTGIVSVMGEISCSNYVDIPSIVRRTVRNIGYDQSLYGGKSCGFDGNTCAVVTAIDEQSPDIALGVDNSFEFKESDYDEADKIGAGDQGMMFGYACDETDAYMPTAIHYAHALCRRLAECRKNKSLEFLRPDGKAQVTVYYDENGKPVATPAIVVSTQHDPDVDMRVLREAVLEEVIKKVIPEKFITKDTKFYINPTGRFALGGPAGDSGLTGRKIIVDTYGGYGRNGGGCFSGKDPTKVDRSASYMARYAAKNLVAAGLCTRCELELAYAIGVASPVSICVDSFGTGKYDDARLAEIVRKFVDFRPASIIKKLELRRPIYLQTAAYGHFGRPDLDLPWEKLDLVEKLRNI